MSAATTPWQRIYNALASLKLAVVTLLFLFLITLLGTLHQVEYGLFEAQRIYFWSWIAFVPVGGTPLIPLPGGVLLMSVLSVNLIIGGLVRMRWNMHRAGILATHIGIVILLAAGLVKFAGSREGMVHLLPNQTTAEYYDAYQWELVVGEVRPDGSVREFRMHEDLFAGLAPGRTTTLTHADLPFDLELSQWHRNCSVAPSADSSAIDGYRFVPLEDEKQAEANMPGLAVRLRGEQEQGVLLWGGHLAPATVTVNNTPYLVDLRKYRYPLPFTLRLDRFEHEYFPGTEVPKFFLSEVTALRDGHERHARIVMNEPLRHAGVIVYQTSFGNENDGRPGMPPGRFWSGFAVVENPSDQWPLIACIVIGIGMSWHFGSVLMRYIKRESRAREEQA